MRVLHLDAGREMRGGQWQVLRLVRGLAATGIECTLLARPDAPLFEAARASGCPVAPFGVLSVAKLARRHDLIHAHDARSHTVAQAVVSCGLRARRLVVSRRVGFPIRSRWKYRGAARYLAVSAFVKSVLIAGGIAPEKIAVVYDGVPVLEPASGDRILTPANAADPAKGAPLAAEAARLAGAGLTASANLEADLHSAALFVYITHSEGLGSAALLAMSAAVPVIASNVGGLVEVVRHGETGLLVENDAEPIAAAIRQLAGDRALARRMGEAGRQRVLEDFTVERMVRRTMEVYREVLA